MPWLNSLLDFVLTSLLQEIIVVIAGVLFARFIYERWVAWRYGKWRVIILKNGEQIISRDISPGKLKEIQAEPAELAVFLKGMASPYSWINCDIIEEGELLGLLNVDSNSRTYTLNLDKNPARNQTTPAREDTR